MKIFISSTLIGLRAERQKAIEQVLKLGHQPIAMEYFSSSSEPPLEECLSRVDESDLLILILGPNYGSVHPGTGLSITESEYRHAKRTGIDVLAFWTQNLEERIAEANGPESLEKYRRLLAAVKSPQTLDSFSSAEQLATAVADAIYKYQSKHGELGRRVNPFVGAREYFESWLDTKRYLNHSWQLVGRRNTLAELEEFVAGDRKVALLYGPGGIGKSKVLFEFSRSFDEELTGWKLRFIRESVPWFSETPRGLPADPTIIVLEDANRYADIESLLGILRMSQYGGRTKLILTLRPSGKGELESQLFRNADVTEVVTLASLRHLRRDEVRALSVEALGNECAVYADRLAHVSWDCPLVTVVGGRLVKEKKIQPELFQSDEDFRREVLLRFTEEITRRLGEPRELWRNILALVSALQPVRPASDGFQKDSSGFLKIERTELFKRFETLEDHGLLFRRGGLVWISPEVLGDFILQEACTTRRNEDTGYAAEVFNAFAASHAKNLLRNLAELQWQIDETRKQPQLLEHIWGDILGAFRSAPYAGRIRVLEIVEPAAAFQPAKALELVREAIRLD